MSEACILAFAGSAREELYNFRLVQVAAEDARNAEAGVVLPNRRNHPLPLFDEDLEKKQGMLENAVRLKRLSLEDQELLISVPEYNSFITPLLKNTIDWVSGRAKGEPIKAVYLDNLAALMGVSPGLSGLVNVRSILSSIVVIVLPDHVVVGRVFEAFDEDGRLKDEKQQANVQGLGESVAKILGRQAQAASVGHTVCRHISVYRSRAETLGTDHQHGRT